MPKPARPFTTPQRADSKTFQIVLNPTCGLPPSVCAEWKRRSFQDLPRELAHYRNPKDIKTAEAAAYALIAYLMKKQGYSETDQNAVNKQTTIEKFARNMFMDGAPHLIRWAAKGNVLKPKTIAQHRRFVENHIIPNFGKLTFQEIRPTAVEDYLLQQNLSNSSRNSIMYTLQLIMREAKREGVIEIIPEFEPFKRNSKRQDVLSGEELTALFPYDEQELISIWKRPDDMRKERAEIALMFGTLFCVTASAGLRSGEARALHQEQVSIPYSGLLIDRALDEEGQLGPLKKANSDDPRSRAIMIPGITLKILARWLERVPKCPGFPGILFSFRKKPITVRISVYLNT